MPAGLRTYRPVGTNSQAPIFLLAATSRSVELEQCWGDCTTGRRSFLFTAAGQSRIFTGFPLTSPSNTKCWWRTSNGLQDMVYSAFVKRCIAKLHGMCRADWVEVESGSPHQSPLDLLKRAGGCLIIAREHSSPPPKIIAKLHLIFREGGIVYFLIGLLVNQVGSRAVKGYAEQLCVQHAVSFFHIWYLFFWIRIFESFLCENGCCILSRFPPHLLATLDVVSSCCQFCFSARVRQNHHSP